MAMRPNQVSCSYVCSAHFLPNDYILTKGGVIRLKNESTPSKNLLIRKFDTTQKSELAKTQTMYKTISVKRQAANDVSLKESNENCNKAADDSHTNVREPDSRIENAVGLEIFESDFRTENTGTQTETYQASIGSQTLLRSSHLSSCTAETLNEKNLKYLTGFDQRRFNLFFNAIQNDLLPNEFEIHLKLPDQLILCLFKLRHNLDYTLIGFMYYICRTTVSKIFQKVIKIVYRYLRAIDFWSQKYLKAGAYTAIIDCTEIKTEKSQNPKTNEGLFSQYKNNFTLKYLVAIDERGLVIFCSQVFGGATSDRATVVESGFLNKLKANDVILADRGFDISDILEKQKVVLNIPPFLRGKGQLSEDETMETRIVANRRIHIERVIGLTKKYAILKDTFPAHLWHLADSIIYSINMLCNFKNSIVNK